MESLTLFNSLYIRMHVHTYITSLMSLQSKAKCAIIIHPKSVFKFKEGKMKIHTLNIS